MRTEKGDEIERKAPWVYIPPVLAWPLCQDDKKYFLELLHSKLLSMRNHPLDSTTVTGICHCSS